MTHIYSVIVIFVLCTSSIFGQETCPTGKPSPRDCSSILCPSDSKCYRKDNKRFCCGELGAFCPTKMHAFNSIDDQKSYLWGPGGKVKTTKWYNVELGGETIACPVPISHTYRSYKELVLPVDFNASNNAASSTPKACIYNSDCKKNNEEFCGATTNPSFLDEVDKSGENGDSLRFCYKFQNFGSINVHPIIKADETELIRCTNNSDCSPTHGAETLCFIKEAKKYDGTTKDGFCAFEKLTTTSIYWYTLFASVGCTIVFFVISVSCFVAHRRCSSYSPTDEESSATTKLSKKKKRSKKNNLSKSKTLSKIAKPPTLPNLNADGKPKFEFDPKVRFDFENEAFGNLPAEDQIRFLTTPANYESFGNLFREKLFRDHKEVLLSR